MTVKLYITEEKSTLFLNLFHKGFESDKLFLKRKQLQKSFES